MTEVSDLEAMDRSALLALWSRLLRAPAPGGMSQVMMRHVLAFELQARRHGGLPAPVRKALQRAGAEADKAKAAPASAPMSSQVPGTRLLREWNGTPHVVEVTVDGCLWNGTRFRSLSAVARAITGARWSGPRFFGLTRAGQ